MSASRRRVVVTGLGIASAIGLDESTVWARLLDGNTGIDEITAFDTTGYRVSIGAEVDSEQLREKLRVIGRRPVDRALDLALVAAADALDQAGVTGPSSSTAADQRTDMAVIFGTGEGSAQSHHTAFTAFGKKGVRGLRPTTVPRCMYNAVSAGISIQFRLSGTNYMVVSACTSATNAIGTAFRMVRDGYTESVLCGGADGFFDPFFFGVWNNLRALSSNPDPRAACRPFAADRDGCVLGEGAGALVIEARDHAISRGARIRGEILGYGESSDAEHLTRPSVEGQARAMLAALDDASVDVADIGLINAHGTATRSNDSTESQSIRMVLGEQVVDQVPVMASKSYFGHTLGASGALETIATLLALEHRMIPANLNLEQPDPECSVRLVGSRPERHSAGIAMKNSFGFGGGNGVLVLAAHPSD